MKRLFTEFGRKVAVALAALVALPSAAMADEPEMWVGSKDKTLTFYYNANRSAMAEKLDATYAVPTGTDVYPDWMSDSYTSVVFDTSFSDARPTSCFYWFCGQSELTTIDGIKNLNTSAVTDMSYMFYGCMSLTTLDLSHFDKTSLVKTYCMFSLCTALATIYSSDSFVFSSDTKSDGQNTGSEFFGCTALGVGTMEKVGLEKANFEGFFKRKEKVAWAEYDSEAKIFTFHYTTADEKNACSNTTYELNEFKGTKTEEDKEFGVEYQVPESGYQPWSGTLYYMTTVKFDESFADARPTTCYRWFQNAANLTTIEGLKYLNTSEVKDMRGMFNNCESLTKLDLSGFNTENVLSMSEMFDGCEKLESLNLSGLANTNVTDMSAMFNNCVVLNDLKLKNFGTQSVVNMSEMFKKCRKLETLDLSSFDTGNVQSFSCMFYTCSALKKLDLSNFKTDKAVVMGGMFMSTPKLETINLSSFNTSNVAGEYGMYGMFQNCGVKELDLSNFDTSKCTSFEGMFASCENLKNLDLTSFNTENVTSMEEMFSQSAFVTLDLSSFNTANVEKMEGMFSYDRLLTTVYASDKFVTTAVTKGEEMFMYCFNITGAITYDENKTDHNYADFDGYLVDKGRKAEYLATKMPWVEVDEENGVLTFHYSTIADRLASANIAISLNNDETTPLWVDYDDAIKTVKFDKEFSEARPTSCYLWFYGFENLTSIEGLENLNTSEVTTMKRMFGGCSSLTTLDLSTFDTGKVTDMSYMFRGDGVLAEIFVSDTFVTDAVDNSDDMFSSCEGLPSYSDDNQNDKTMANYTTGYFKYKASGSVTAIDRVNAGGLSGDAEYYDLMGRKMAAPSKGMVIVRKGGVGRLTISK